MNGTKATLALVIGMAVFIAGAMIYNLDFLHMGRNSAHSERSALKAGDAQAAMDHLTASDDGGGGDVDGDGVIDEGEVNGAARAAEVSDERLTSWRQQGVALAQMASRSRQPQLAAFAEDMGDVDRRALESSGTETMASGYALDDVADADFDRIYLDAWIAHLQAMPASSPRAGTTNAEDDLFTLRAWKASWFPNSGSRVLDVE